MAQILSYTENFLPNCRSFSNQSTRGLSKCPVYPCEGPKGQPATLRPYVIDTSLNLIGRHLLMQWHAQIYIPHFALGPLLT